MTTLLGMLLVGARYIVTIYMWMMIAAWIFQLVGANARMPLLRGLYAITEPLPRWVRTRFPKLVIPTGSGYVDLSGLIVLLALGALAEMISYLARSL